jgi:prephenate dehydrogenase
MQVRRLSILGMGLLGGSIGLALRSRAKYCVVVGYAHRKETRELALRLGAVSEVFDDPAQAVADADCVVLCTPVGLLTQLLEQISGKLSPDAIVTDVGSTKRTVVEAGERLLPAGVHFVGSHPMAGSEKRGIEFSRADLYERAVCITTPTPRTDPFALEKVEGLWKLLGMRTTRLSPEEHDRLLADVSHLPHVVAAALVAMQEEPAFGLCGKGFLDATRIAAGDSGLWRDILLDNQTKVRASLKRLIESLQGFEALLDSKAPGPLEAWLSHAASLRHRLASLRERPSGPK